MTKEIYEVGLRTPTALNIHIRKVLAVTMASKTKYWKCVDCNSIINDGSMRTPVNQDDPLCPLVAEFCECCYVYNPEVVISYA